MPVKGGKDGFVQNAAASSAFTDIQNWEFNYSANAKSYGSSSTAGHKKSIAGVYSGELSFTAVLNTDAPIYDDIKVGDQVTVHAYEDDTRKWIIPVTIDTMGEAVDMDEGEVIGVPITAVTNGAWTYPDGTVSAN